MMNTFTKNLSSHYLICGFDKISRGICYRLKEENIHFIIIDPEKKSLEYANMRSYDIINDDPANDATLIAAGIEKAAGIVACSSNDSTNLYITLAARELNPDIHIIACSSEPSKENRMRRAGADKVVYPEYLGGEEIARIIYKEPISDTVLEENSSTSGILGYFLKVYNHLDEEPVKLEDILRKTSAVMPVAVIRNAVNISEIPSDFILKKNDIIILALNKKHQESGGPEKMNLLKWTSDFSVGIVSIDKEHKKIVDAINKVITSFRRNDGNRALNQILDELFDYAIEHFKNEEQLFAKYNYPDMSEHINIHKDILEKIKELSNHINQIHPETLYVFLKSWIKYHFGVIDQKYSKFLIEQGVE